MINNSEVSNSTIAKNTVFLYFRMAITVVVGLYTSRVILNTLGVDDFGLYNVAGSVVAIWSFISGAIGNSSSRFITFQLGRINIDGMDKLKACYGTTQFVMAIIAGLILLICETIGLWILFQKSGIQMDRMTAAFWTYQISVLTAMFSITQIPYTALIIAHERMGIYAYMSIIEVVLKLLVVYLLVISPMDKLIFYSVLLCIVQVLVMMFYRIYCRKQFEESKAKIHLDKSFFKPILSFSGWSLLGSATFTLFSQVSNVIISAFFNPAVVAGRAIATQVRNTSAQFVTNFRTAANPQIIKRYSEGNIEGYKKLLFQSTDISFYLMLIIIVPIFIEAEPILTLWLKTVPEYTIPFVRIALVEALFAVYDTSYYMIFQVTGRLKENAIICPMLDIVVFIIVIITYYLGSSPISIAWGLLLLTVLQGMIVKPYLAIHFFGFKWSDFTPYFFNNALVLLLSCILPVVLLMTLTDSMVNEIVIFISSLIVTGIIITFVGLNREQRTYIMQLVVSKIHKR